MKHRIANQLRKIAHKLYPEHVQSVEVTWKRNEPPFVDLQFRNGQRVVGHVFADSPYTVPADQVPS